MRLPSSPAFRPVVALALLALGACGVSENDTRAFEDDGGTFELGVGVACPVGAAVCGGTPGGQAPAHRSRLRVGTSASARNTLVQTFTTGSVPFYPATIDLGLRQIRKLSAANAAALYVHADLYAIGSADPLVLSGSAIATSKQPVSAISGPSTTFTFDAGAAVLQADTAYALRIWTDDVSSSGAEVLVGIASLSALDFTGGSAFYAGSRRTDPGTAFPALDAAPRSAGADVAFSIEASAACVVAAGCPGSDTSCSTRTCIAGTCGATFASAGTACNQNGGVQCDGAGECTAPPAARLIGVTTIGFGGWPATSPFVFKLVVGSWMNPIAWLETTLTSADAHTTRSFDASSPGWAAFAAQITNGVGQDLMGETPYSTGYLASESSVFSPYTGTVDAGASGLVRVDFEFGDVVINVGAECCDGYSFGSGAGATYVKFYGN